MLPLALSILGAGAAYFVAKVASGGGAVLRETAASPALPVAPVSRVPTAAPKPTAKEPPPAPVEVTPPPVTPTPPVDTSPKLPTPPLPPPVAPVVRAAPPASVPMPAAHEEEPPPAAVEAAPPPTPPTPPPDTSAALPTPPVDAPARQWGPTIDVPVGDKYAAASAQAAPPVAPSAPHDGPPAGFDAALASMLAPALAKQLAAKGYSYDRAALKAFQTAAGLTPDGIYGDDSWGALLFFTSAAPKALFKPSSPTPYAWAHFATGMPAQSAALAPPMQIAAPPDAGAPPAAAVDVGPIPPPGFNPVSARNMAKQVANNIQSKGSSYARQLLKDFQKVAGLEADGIYGGASRRALIFYGVARPPTALFKPTAMPATYLWEAQAKAQS